MIGCVNQDNKLFIIHYDTLATGPGEIFFLPNLYSKRYMHSLIIRVYVIYSQTALTTAIPAAKNHSINVLSPTLLP